MKIANRISLLLTGWVFFGVGMFHNDFNSIGIGFIFFGMDILYTKEEK